MPAEQPPYRGAAPATPSFPLQSDPRWLRLGLLAATVASIGFFVAYFALQTPRPPLALALLPGLAVATFAGSWLAWWGRRRGGTLRLEAQRHRLVLIDPATRESLLDRAAPFAAATVRDTATGRRLLLLSQSGEPITVLDTRASTEAPAGWQDRTVDVDLSDVALSPSSSNVLTLAVQSKLDPLLAELATDLSPAAPLLSYPLPSGEVLLVHRDEIRVGNRVVPLGRPGRARQIAIHHEGEGKEASSTPALAIDAGETTLLFARHDARDAAAPDARAQTPDAYLPPLIFALVAQLLGATSPAVATPA